jgi:thiol:disulfide interchange protein
MQRSSPLVIAAGLVLWAVLGAGALGSAAAPAGDEARQPDFSSWLSGAEGWSNGLRLGQQERKPVFLYFYTDWCGYCRQFERELLSDPDLQDYLESIVAVRVNPEAGPAEATVARRYGVSSFPSLFVHSAESPAVSQVDRMRLVEGRPVLMTPAMFIDVVKTAGAR